MLFDNHSYQLIDILDLILATFALQTPTQILLDPNEVVNILYIYTTTTNKTLFNH